MAINREQTSSDFVLIWPYEIQCHIFSFLSTEELVECLNVCLQWQRQLLQCTSLWHDLQLTNIRPDCFQMLHHNTAHVKALFINDDGTDLKAAFQMLMSCDFENLKSLTLRVEFPDNDLFQSVIYPALRNVGSSLDEVDFAYFDFKTLSFERVLEYCPNISRIKYNGCDLEARRDDGNNDEDTAANNHEMDNHTSIHNDISSSSTSASFQRLTHIFLHVDGYSVDPQSLRRILQRSQRLKQLLISYCNPEILNVIFICCPELRYLNFNMSANQDYNIVRMAFADDDDDDGEATQHGLRVMKLTNSGERPITTEQIQRFVTRNSSTLTKFEFSSSIYVAHAEQQIPCFNQMFPTVTTSNSTLQRFHCDAPIDISSLPDLLRQCRALEDVKLSKVDLECLHLLLTHLPRLCKLHLIRCEELQERDLITFFVSCKDAFASTTRISGDDKEGSDVDPVKKTLILEDFASLTDTSLDHLADIPALHTLAIKDCTNVTEVGLQHFVRKLQALTCIELMLMDSVTNTVVSTLGTISGLETVSLVALDRVSLTGISELLNPENRTHLLRRLYVVECNIADGAALKSITTSARVALFTTGSPLKV